METGRRPSAPPVSSLFASMEYGPALESRKVADAWLDKHERNFGLFINNEWVHPEGGRKTYETRSPGSGEGGPRWVVRPVRPPEGQAPVQPGQARAEAQQAGGRGGGPRQRQDRAGDEGRGHGGGGP